jgi:hypothetical protein
LRSATGIDLGPLSRKTAVALSRGNAPPFVPPDAGDAEAMAKAAGERSRALHERVVPAVDLFLAPSRFLRDRDRRVGITSKIEHLRFGMDLGSFRAP